MLAPPVASAPGSRPPLTIEALQQEAVAFAREESVHAEPSLFGVTDGKTVGTYLEQKFRTYVASRYEVTRGNSAKGIDFPILDVDIKVTSRKQPQSSCPFKSARQKIFGLGYSLLVFVYDKTDDATCRTSRLNMLHTIFLDASTTADFTMTHRLREMIADGANREDIVAYLNDRSLPVDEIGAQQLADEVLRAPPPQGYLTISNALQWRLQYGHAIEVAGAVAGVRRLGG
ncbi:restriction endonuclease [Sorangium cellulosum]|uniref:Restriction endonuclease n=1 Tax=Sorangium cellulosum TaxID=56 RepID=A0A150P4C3_SORCE|nr:restriction endonuclease [Sorangium cellulosum]